MWWQPCLFLCPEGRTSAQPFPLLRDRPCRHVPPSPMMVKLVLALLLLQLRRLVARPVVPADPEGSCLAEHRKTRQLLTCPVLHAAHFPPHRPVFDPLDRSPATPLPTQYDTTRACIQTCKGADGRHDFGHVLYSHGGVVPVRQAAAARDSSSQNTFFPVCVGATCFRLPGTQPFYSWFPLTLQAVFHQEQASAFTLFLSYSIRPLSVSFWTLVITTAQSSPCSLGFPL